MKVIAVSLCSVMALCVCSMAFCVDESQETPARRPLILLTNDDGIESAGIKALMKELPRVADVIVVAPATNKSGVSQSLTYRGDIKVFKREVPEELKDLERKPIALYAVEGTPATCVLLGAGNLSQGRSFDLVVSGINPGSNIGSDGNLSGTVGAARMGADIGLAGLAVSSASGSKYVAQIAASLASFIEQAFSAGVEKGVLLNVNYPGGEPKDWKGATLTDVGAGNYKINFRKVEGGEDAGEPPREDKTLLLFRAAFARAGGEAAGGTARAGIAAGKICVTPIASLSLPSKASSKSLSMIRKRLAGLAFFK
ncbi:MAG: 5'/3'-nucleotidase SurE [Planctomycetota bacterium]|nr:5'/3'-nucleotidase SurE [Planctomycetota bacterium]